MNWMFKEVNCYLKNWFWELIQLLVLRWFFFFLFSLYFPIPPFWEGFTLYSFILHYPDRTLLHYLSFHLSICPIRHLFSSPWMVVVETALFRGLLHINAARKVVAVHLMRWWQPLLLIVFASSSSLHVPKIHHYRWIFLEGHLNCLSIWLTDILCIRGV